MKLKLESSSGIPRLISKSSIVLVCKQVHGEYFEALQKAALSTDNSLAIEVTVTDCDFTDIMTFTSSIELAQRAALRPGSNKLRIDFALTEPPFLHEYEEDLKAWLQYCSTAGIGATY